MDTLPVTSALILQEPTPISKPLEDDLVPGRRVSRFYLANFLTAPTR